MRHPSLQIFSKCKAYRYLALYVNVNYLSGGKNGKKKNCNGKLPVSHGNNNRTAGKKNMHPVTFYIFVVWM